MNITLTKGNKIGLTICFIYILLIIFYYHIDKYLSGAVFIVLTLLIPLSFIAILIYSINGVIEIIQSRNAVLKGPYVLTAVCIILICYSIFSPFRLTSEILESDVELRACYEGTQNQATLKFRKDKTFELHWTGAFFANQWFTGKWSRIGNVMHLKYDDKKPEPLGNVILIKDGYLLNIDQAKRVVKLDVPMFYLGYCKHEN